MAAPPGGRRRPRVHAGFAGLLQRAQPFALIGLARARRLEETRIAGVTTRQCAHLPGFARADRVGLRQLRLVAAAATTDRCGADDAKRIVVRIAELGDRRRARGLVAEQGFGCRVVCSDLVRRRVAAAHARLREPLRRVALALLAARQGPVAIAIEIQRTLLLDLTPHPGCDWSCPSGFSACHHDRLLHHAGSAMSTLSSNAVPMPALPGQADCPAACAGPGDMH